MEYLHGKDRTQLTLYSTCLDDMVPSDNTVRLIDLFVKSLDFEQMGFESLSTQGRLFNLNIGLKGLFIWLKEHITSLLNEIFKTIHYFNDQIKITQ